MRSRLLKKGLNIVIVSACLMAMPLTVSAKQSWQNESSLLELDTIAGNQGLGFVDGTLEEAGFSFPTGIVQLSTGEIIVTDTLNHKLREITSDSVSTYSGYSIGYDELGYAIGALYDDALDKATYQNPTGIAVTSDETIYIADSANHAIRKITTDGQVTTIAGNGLIGLKDGKGVNARFNQPSDIAVDEQGNVYVADTLNHVIRKINATGQVTTLTATSDRNVEYNPGAVSDAGDYKDGKISEAKFNEPTGLAIDKKGNLYVADRGNQRIRYIDFANDLVTTIAGSGSLESQAMYIASGYEDGQATDAKFNSPEGISLTVDETLLIADRNNHVIRAFKDGQVSTIVGIGEEYGSVDGVLSVAKLNEPTDVIELKDGRLAIVDSAGHKIRVLQNYQAPEKGLDLTKLQILVNGQWVETDAEPFISDNRTMVPLRSIAEALGLSINYEHSNGSISLVDQDGTAYVFGKQTSHMDVIQADGESATILLDKATEIEGNRLFVPARFIAEQLSYDVAWDSENKNVVIRKLAN